MKETILIIEDEDEVMQFINDLLVDNGFNCLQARSGQQALLLNKMHHPHLILLDLTLPDGHGQNFIQPLRADYVTPIIAVTGRANDIDRIIGLEIGMDDYITKPFNPRELIARIRAVLRRTTPQNEFISANSHDQNQEKTYQFDTFTFFEDQRKLTKDNKEIKLTIVELEYLRFFLERANRVQTREHILNHIQKNNLDVIDRTVDVTIMRLRRKIELNPSQPHYLQTVRGLGYLFKADVQIKA